MLSLKASLTAPKLPLQMTFRLSLVMTLAALGSRSTISGVNFITSTNMSEYQTPLPSIQQPTEVRNLQESVISQALLKKGKWRI